MYDHCISSSPENGGNNRPAKCSTWRKLNFDALAYEVSVQFIVSKPPFAIREEKFYCLAVCIIRSYILCVLSAHSKH